MLIHSDRRWSFPAPADAVWDQMNAVDRYRSWWPWLRTFDADALDTAHTWTCAVQPPLPYSLRFAVRLDEVVPGSLVTATIAGDIEGEARLELFPADTGCAVHLVSSLAPGNRLLRAIAAVARPMVRYGHDWVLDTGARQFASRLPAD
ncbi:MAG: hypothetical protein M3Z46_12555 [Actinomycetota bacterium]|nr:hypothetical protein [Actinomycetota bacterium]